MVIIIKEVENGYVVTIDSNGYVLGESTYVFATLNEIRLLDLTEKAKSKYIATPLTPYGERMKQEQGIQKLQQTQLVSEKK